MKKVKNSASRTDFYMRIKTRKNRELSNALFYTKAPYSKFNRVYLHCGKRLVVRERVPLPSQ